MEDMSYWTIILWDDIRWDVVTKLSCGRTCLMENMSYWMIILWDDILMGEHVSVANYKMYFSYSEHKKKLITFSSPESFNYFISNVVKSV